MEKIINSKHLTISQHKNNKNITVEAKGKIINIDGTDLVFITKDLLFISPEELLLLNLDWHIDLGLQKYMESDNYMDDRPNHVARIEKLHTARFTPTLFIQGPRNDDPNYSTINNHEFGNSIYLYEAEKYIEKSEIQMYRSEKATSYFYQSDQEQPIEIKGCPFEVVILKEARTAKSLYALLNRVSKEINQAISDKVVRKLKRIK
ncbi:MAG: hypothetical protein KF816_02835 [Melioribacteraceae bacterium]|jgi:hypothetical protein|nr:hypothetical protein [Melioribacteraceae bacterium]